MVGTFFAEIDPEALRSNRSQIRRAAKGARENPGHGHEESVPRGVFHHHDVQQTVVDHGVGGDAGAAAVLFAIGQGDQQGRDPGLAPVVMQSQRGRPVSKKLTHAQLDVGPSTPATARLAVFKRPGDSGVEAEPRDIEKEFAVDASDVDSEGPVRRQRARGGGGIEGDIEFARQSVARSLGQDAQRRGRADEGPSDLVDRPVAADGDDRVEPIGHGPPGQFPPVAAAFRSLKAVRPAAAVERAPHSGFKDRGIAARPRRRIQDERVFHEQ
ncbi:MAG: hypothetical protein IPI26_07870 [Elusimicrobia bacterium]|nr:hypothetical protein [Elusimicrobiota bacterium]